MDEHIEQTAEELLTEAQGQEDPVSDAPEGDTEQSTLDIFGEKYSEEELKELLDAGKNARSFIASATQKAQEAAEIRRQAEEASQYAELGKALLEKYQNEGEEGANQLLQALKVMVPTQKQAEPSASLQTEYMTENEQALYAHIQQQQAQIQQLAKLVGDVLPQFQDVGQYVGTLKEQAEIAQTVADAKARYGIDLTAEAVREMKASGIADPVKALGYMQGLFRAAVPKKAPEAPVGKNNIADESEMSVDDILLSRFRGNVG